MAFACAPEHLSTCTHVPRPVFFEDGVLHLIDQKVLPGALTMVAARDVEAVYAFIKDMTVRGAPAIGAAGAFGLALAANASTGTTPAALLGDVATAKARLDSSRPTAVNLAWATGRIYDIARAYAALPRTTVASLRAAIEAEARALAEEDVAINRALARHGAELIQRGDNILHHCNTGALATVDIGTALGVIYEAHGRGLGIHVWVDETRPRLQGSKLTAWELMRGGVPMHLIVDSAAGMLMADGKVDVFLFGADRVAANGDVANKVGTYKNAVCAWVNGLRSYACVPTSTIDLETRSGKDIHIEERPSEEVTVCGGVAIAPEGVRVYNPAFDVTPARFLTGIITEEGVCYPPYPVSLRAAKERAEARAKAAWEEKLSAVV